MIQPSTRITRATSSERTGTKKKSVTETATPSAGTNLGTRKPSVVGRAILIRSNDALTVDAFTLDEYRGAIEALQEEEPVAGAH